MSKFAFDFQHTSTFSIPCSIFIICFFIGVKGVGAGFEIRVAGYVLRVSGCEVEGTEDWRTSNIEHPTSKEKRVESFKG